MNDLSKISSTDIELERRLPQPFEGDDVNFCRNPQCASYGIFPDPYKRSNGTPPPEPGILRGSVEGRLHKEFFKCPTCGTKNRLKNNKAIFEEYSRLRELQYINPAAASCKNEDCENSGKALSIHPEL